MFSLLAAVSAINLFAASGSSDSIGSNSGSANSGSSLWACPTKWISCLIRVTYGTSFTMRGATLVTMQHHQILRLPRNSEFRMSAETPWIVSANIKTIRPDSDDNPTIIRRYPTTSEHKIVISHPPLRRPYPCHLGQAFCIEKYNISRSGYLPKFQEVLRLPRKVTLQLHQILRLPHKMNLILDPRHLWNVIYNARSNKSHNPTAANTAPATELWLYWSVTLLNCYSTELLLYSSELLL